MGQQLRTLLFFVRKTQTKIHRKTIYTQ